MAKLPYKKYHTTSTYCYVAIISVIVLGMFFCGWRVRALTLPLT